MNCPTCGNALAAGAAFCSVCGRSMTPGAAAPAPAIVVPVAVQTRTSGMAIAGFVLSFFCGILGLIFSILGRNESKRSNGTVTGDGLALAGIIISILNLLCLVFYIALVFVFVREARHAIDDVSTTISRKTVNQIAYEAYPQWSVAHPGEKCPASVDDLREYASSFDMTDSWGKRFKMLCGADAPSGKGVVIISAGPDGKFDTADDIRSD
jgi:hypothetical protein